MTRIGTDGTADAGREPPPKRTKAEGLAVERAKAILMRRHGLTEPEAHRFLQQYAMNHSMKMADCAARIIEASADAPMRTEE